MENSREEITKGFQECDVCRIVTDTNQRIYIKIVKTKGGYVKMEFDMPKRYEVDKIRRDEEIVRVEV